MRRHVVDRRSEPRGRLPGEDDRVRSLRRLTPLVAALALGACAELAPLRQPPLNPADDLDAVSTREEAIERFGPPHAIRSSDLGPVLVYRRAVVVDANPNRYYGEDR